MSQSKIDELERLLNSEEDVSIEILPNGEIRQLVQAASADMSSEDVVIDEARSACEHWSHDDDLFFSLVASARDEGLDEAAKVAMDNGSPLIANAILALKGRVPEKFKREAGK